MTTKIVSKVWELMQKVKRKIQAHGLIYVLERIVWRIDYPRNGFTRYGVDQFVNEVVAQIKKDQLVIDVAAGYKPYEHLFEGKRYHSCDYPNPSKGINTDQPRIVHSFYCDLSDMPISNNKYDAVLCTQVLEHVQEPIKVVKEFERILKPSGMLFLTVPQCYGSHMVPHNYFNFHSYGLKWIFESAGFQVESIEAMGGIFWLLGNVVLHAFMLLWERMGKLKVILFPIYIMSKLLLCLFFILLFYMDKLDKERKWTLGYKCVCKKPS